MSKTTIKYEPVELDIPDGVGNSDQAVEMLRAWIGDGALLLSLNADALGDRVVEWGRMLGEIAHHIARSAKLNGHMSDDQALQAIRAGFDAAMRSPQPTLSGKVRRPPSH
jgi:hypothetical protein